MVIDIILILGSIKWNKQFNQEAGCRWCVSPSDLKKALQSERVDIYSCNNTEPIWIWNDEVLITEKCTWQKFSTWKL